jgi:biopolymer transport protein ExbD
MATVSDTAPVEVQDADSEINLTPMLDVVFIMLIFFIVAASFIKETGIEVNRPETTQRTVTEASSILISIGENNDIWMDSRLIDPRAVRANIERMHAVDPDAPVVVRADRRSYNDTLVQVMDASRQAGIYDVSIATW